MTLPYVWEVGKVKGRNSVIWSNMQEDDVPKVIQLVVLAIAQQAPKDCGNATRSFIKYIYSRDTL